MICEHLDWIVKAPKQLSREYWDLLSIGKRGKFLLLKSNNKNKNARTERRPFERIQEIKMMKHYIISKNCVYSLIHLGWWAELGQQMGREKNSSPHVERAAPACSLLRLTFITSLVKKNFLHFSLVNSFLLVPPHTLHLTHHMEFTARRINSSVFLLN